MVYGRIVKFLPSQKSVGLAPLNSVRKMLVAVLYALLVFSFLRGALTCRGTHIPHVAVHCDVFFPPDKDVATISRRLGDVQDWEELAGLLNVNSIEIKTDCAQDLCLAKCYRRELVRHYCDSQQSENPKNVAEDIAAELEKMGNTRQGAQLRESFRLGGLMS